MADDIYSRLANHLFLLGVEYDQKEGLEALLRETYTPLEAEVALALPTKVMPLQPVGVDEIIDKVDLPREELVDILENLSERGLLFSGTTKDGKKGYALHQRGFGFPQAFFWKGEDTPTSRKMADLLTEFYKSKALMPSHPTSKTPAFQFIPVNEAIEPGMQAVYPYTMLEKVIEQARVIAVAHCPCRIRAKLRGRGCDHLTEVCLKFDDMAEYLIEKGLGREITKEEALELIKKSEEDGLVHFVDNALGDIKHNCNCCSCCCWALGPIKRRKIPRDLIMATYFIRETDEDECTGCGTCIEICPVNAITLVNDSAVIDEDWCVGCGLCVSQCSNSAAKLRQKPAKTPSQNFTDLHEGILREKGLR